MEFVLSAPALTGILVCAFFIAGFSRRILKKRVKIPWLRTLLAGLLGTVAGGWASLSLIVYAKQVIDHSPEEIVLWSAFVIGILLSFIPAFMAAKPETIDSSRPGQPKDPGLN